MNIKENLINTLSGIKTDIVPVISATQIGISEGMEATETNWPEAHKNPEQMAKLGTSLYELASLECARIPFCLTVEAEAMGATVELGNNERVPEVKESPFENGEDIEVPDDFLENGRIPVVIEAIDIIKEEYPDLPLIVGVTGPFTLTGHLLGIENLVRLMKTDISEVETALENSLDGCMDYIEEIVDHGADVICIAEPSASPELIDPIQFKTTIKPVLEDLANFIECKKVLHICGSTQDIITDMVSIGYDGISIEEGVDLIKAKEDIERLESKTGACMIDGYPHKSMVIGNISTSQTLFSGSIEDVKRDVKKALDDGVNILAPSCGLAPKSPLKNIKTMVEERNEYYKN